MLIEPKVREFICTTAHPTGCRENVLQQIAYVKKYKKVDGPKHVLIIGASTGYGLATRIAATYGYHADTIGVMYEKPASDKRTATAGYYNTLAFEEEARKDGYQAYSINADAFGQDAKDQVIDLIRQHFGQVDLVVYSLAAPRRTVLDVTYHSVLKTKDKPFTNRTLNLRTNELTTVTIPPATKEEELATVKVMGGEDWEEWILQLKNAEVLAKDATTIAYSYIGPEMTYPIYAQGTIGLAKEHLYQTSLKLDALLKETGGKAFISVNKAVVTQASAAIPIVPLYLSILYHVMKKLNLHEDCMEQMTRLYLEVLPHKGVNIDSMGRIRMDDYEMSDQVQNMVKKIWTEIEPESLKQYADIEGYWKAFYQLFGFGLEQVDYTKEVTP